VVCVAGRSNFPLSNAKMKPRVVFDDAAIKLHSKNSSGEMMIEESDEVGQVRSLSVGVYRSVSYVCMSS
jgi:hypothetical protein